MIMSHWLLRAVAKATSISGTDSSASLTLRTISVSSPNSKSGLSTLCHFRIALGSRQSPDFSQSCPYAQMVGEPDYPQNVEQNNELCD